MNCDTETLENISNKSIFLKKNLNGESCINTIENLLCNGLCSSNKKSFTKNFSEKKTSNKGKLFLIFL